MNNLTTLTRNRGLLDNLWEDFWGETSDLHFPKVQIQSSDTNYKVTAELPGIDKKDVKVEVEDGYLKISGKKEEKESKEYRSVHSELQNYSEFKRSLPIDSSRFDVSKIDAKLENGLLAVLLPIKEVAKPKQITIQGD